MERCNHDDTSGCVPGAEFEITDDQWRCRAPLADYAADLGGTLPLKVTAKFTQPIETSGPVIDLQASCIGDGTEAIDLILDIQGDGRTVGGTATAVSVKLDARDLDITGKVNCGPRAPGAHQNGIQAQGASNIAFVDLEVGDWEANRSTCTGASGGIVIAMAGVAEITPVDYKCIRCRVVACRRAIRIGLSERVEIRDSFFRSGNESERTEPLATGEVGICRYAVSTCDIDPTRARDTVFENNVCEDRRQRGR